MLRVDAGFAGLGGQLSGLLSKKKKQNAGDGASFQFHFSLDASWFYLR